MEYNEAFIKGLKDWLQKHNKLPRNLKIPDLLKFLEDFEKDPRIQGFIQKLKPFIIKPMFQNKMAELESWLAQKLGESAARKAMEKIAQFLRKFPVLKRVPVAKLMLIFFLFKAHRDEGMGMLGAMGYTVFELSPLGDIWTILQVPREGWGLIWDLCTC